MRVCSLKYYQKFNLIFLVVHIYILSITNFVACHATTVEDKTTSFLALLHINEKCQQYFSRCNHIEQSKVDWFALYRHSKFVPIHAGIDKKKLVRKVLIWINKYTRRNYLLIYLLWIWPKVCLLNRRELEMTKRLLSKMMMMK